MDFDTAFDRVIGHEGGYVNNPKDPGGETNWGISKRAYPKLDIKKLTRDEAKAVYRRDYWDKLPPLRPGLEFQMFDFAVNSGVAAAVKALQRALNQTDDGAFGPRSQSALGHFTVDAIVARLLAERLDLMTRLDNWTDAGKGWARRVAGNLRYGSG